QAFGLAPESDAFYLDSGRGGYFGALEDVDGATASKTLKEGNVTLAAHCGHVTWILGTAVRMSDGEQFEPDWNESWLVNTVTDAEWAELKGTMRHNYDALVSRIEARTDWDEASLSGSLITLVHSVYHLGEVK